MNIYLWCVNPRVLADENPPAPRRAALLTCCFAAVLNTVSDENHAQSSSCVTADERKSASRTKVNKQDVILRDLHNRSTVVTRCRSFQNRATNARDQNKKLKVTSSANVKNIGYGRPATVSGCESENFLSTAADAGPPHGVLYLRDIGTVNRIKQDFSRVSTSSRREDSPPLGGYAVRPWQPPKKTVQMKRIQAIQDRKLKYFNERTRSVSSTFARSSSRSNECCVGKPIRGCGVWRREYYSVPLSAKSARPSLDKSVDGTDRQQMVTPKTSRFTYVSSGRCSPYFVHILPSQGTTPGPGAYGESTRLPG